MTWGLSLWILFICLYVLNRWVLPIYWGRFPTD